MKTHKAFNIFMVVLMIAMAMGAPMNVLAQSQDLYPNIVVSLHRNAVIDQGWPENTTLILSIDDPSNGSGEDYTAQITAGQGETFPYAYLGFALYDAFQIQPGQIVTVSDGGYSVTHIVKDLQITNVDSENDIVSGKCTPGSEVRVTILSLGQRTVMVDQAGNWSVDFSEPDGEFTYNITPNIEMPFHCYDKESNSGETESMYPARIVVSVHGDVSVHNWKVGQPIVLEIDDPATQQSPDFSTVSGPWMIGPWFYTGVQFPVSQAIDLQPGFLVTATQGTQVQTYTITDITINEVNVDEDTVSGTANPNAYVLVNVNSGDEGLQLVQADGEGNWTADYKVPGSFPPWQATADILEDTYVSASEFDDNGNHTHTVVNWHLAHPRIVTRPKDDWIRARDWLLGTMLTLRIDDPSNGTGVDFTAYATAAQGDFGPLESYADFALNGFDVQPGQTLTVTGGGIERTMVPTDLTVTDINVNADTVSGTSTSDLQVMVHACDYTGDNCSDNLYITPDVSTHTWTVDFSGIFDLVLGSNGVAEQRDAIGNITRDNWEVANPNFAVRVNSNWVEANEWTLGSSLTLEIDDPDNGPGVDYTDTQTVEEAPWDPNQTYVEIQFAGSYDVQPGDMVTLTDGVTSKTHIVASLEITSFDIENDLVYGVAEPDSYINNVWVCDNENCSSTRHVNVDSEGNWMADFGNPGDEDDEQDTHDIVGGNWVDAQQGDEDGDFTFFGMNVPNPRIRALPAVNEVHGYDWPMGASVQLTIDDDTDPNNGFLYKDTKTVERMDWDWNHTEILFHLWEDDFTLQPSQYITMTDGNTIKTHWVTNLSVTTIDPVADTVSGKAAPDSDLGHWACDENGCANRFIIADENGDWIADFAHVGENDGEQDLLDIRAGVGGDVYQNDDDGDYTEVQWRVPNPTFTANLTENGISDLWNWQDGALLSLTIDHPGTPQSPDYTETKIYDPVNRTHFNLEEFILKIGDLVTVTDGYTTKSTIVANVSITEINVDNETISGTADPFTNVRVNVWAAGLSRLVQADANGNWLADFSEEYDIHAGDNGRVTIEDSDGDRTGEYYHVNYTLTRIEAYPDMDRIGGGQWPLGATITIEIDDPVTPQNPDYIDNVMVGMTEDPFQTWFDMDINGYDLKTGDVITATDGTTIKQLIVGNLMITAVDLDADMVHGVAEPNQTGDVFVGNRQGGSRYLTADQEGNWSANFAVPGDWDGEWEIVDLRPESRIVASFYDADCDATVYRWFVPNQPPTANAGPDIDAYIGDIITLDASASSDPDGDMLIYEWDLDNDSQYNDASGVTTTTSFNQLGGHTIGLRVTDEGGLSDTDTVTITVLPWILKGFYQPVDMNGIYNLVKGGSTVPLKFEIFAGTNELTDIAYVKSLTYAQTSCDATAVTDEIETIATGGTSLRYDVSSGQFIYNWKTPKSVGICYRVTMTTIDGSTLMAYFKLK